MFKQKLKLGLIEDYIKLLKFEKFFSDNENLKYSNCCKFNNLLSNCYINLFFKLKLMDVSLSVLKKEVFEAPYMDIDIEYVKVEQNLIMLNLKEKLNKLKLNDIEKSYILSRLNVKNC